MNIQTVQTICEFEASRGRVHFDSRPFTDTIQGEDWSFNFSYERPDENSARATFKHIFTKFKKGIYAQIKEKQLAHFLPFDNKYYTNDWHEKVSFGNFRFNPGVQEPRHWYANNYLVRFEKPFSQSEIGRRELHDMFIELCSAYNVPDVEFFLNRRDFPIWTRDNTRAYDAIYGLLEPGAQPARASLILSMVSGERFCDVAIPTPDDWCRVTGKLFSETKRSRASMFVDDFSQNWRDKKDIAVFRGSNTGRNFGERRIKLCEICRGLEHFDAKLTGLTGRWQFIDGVLRAPDVAERTKGIMGNFLSLREQSDYKYIIHMEGHVQSFRLSAELATYSVILYVAGETKLWFESKLVPWKHFVPVRADLSDLLEKMSWCRKHQDECEKIAHNARAFYDTYLSKKGCLDYLYQLICSYRRRFLPVMYSCSDLTMREEELIARYKEPARSNCPILSGYRCYINILNMREQLNERVKTIKVLRREEGVVTRVLDLVGPTCVSIKKAETAQANLAREIAIGLYCINPLVEEIPNFVYTYGACRNGAYIECVLDSMHTLTDYIKSRAFRFESFLCILKQIALALAHAQNKCFFIHGRLTPSNILICQYPDTQFDYVVADDTIWRLRTEHMIPIFINYRYSSALGKISFTLGAQKFEPFRDCIWVLVKSAREILHHNVLTAKQGHELISLFHRVFANTDGIFFSPKTSFFQFVSQKHTDEFLLNADLGNAIYQSPMVLFEAISNRCFARAESLQKIHFGKIGAIYSLPAENLPLFTRYLQQKLARATAGTHAEQHLRDVRPARNITKGWMVRRDGDILPLKYLETLNIIQSLLLDGSSFALDQKEKDELKAKIREIRALKIQF